MLQQREAGKYKAGNIQCEICINMNVGLETNANLTHAKELLTKITSHANHTMRCPINYDLTCPALLINNRSREICNNVCVFLYIVWNMCLSGYVVCIWYNS